MDAHNRAHSRSDATADVDGVIEPNGNANGCYILADGSADELSYAITNIPTFLLAHIGWYVCADAFTYAAPVVAIDSVTHYLHAEPNCYDNSQVDADAHSPTHAEPLRQPHSGAHTRRHTITHARSYISIQVLSRWRCRLLGPRCI
jgi:hypothetical protein